MNLHSVGLRFGLFVLAFSAAAARADTINVFMANGLLSDGTVLGGTLTVDQTTGTVESSNLIATGGINATFTAVTEYHRSYNGMSYDQIDDATANGKTELNFSVSPSLGGFKGGNVNGGNIYYPGAGSPYGPNINFLSLSLPATVTPEPSTLLLIGTAMAGVPALRRGARRRGSRAA